MTEFVRAGIEPDGTALYRWEPKPEGARTRLFYLGAFDVGSAPEDLSLEESWNTPGAYLFCPGEPTAGFPELLAALGLSREHIGQDPTARVLAWLPEPGGEGAVPVSLVWGGPRWGHVSYTDPPQSVPFGNIRLHLSSEVQISLDNEQVRIVLQGSGGSMGLRPLPYPNVPPEQEPPALAPLDFTLVLELASDSLGSLTGAARWKVHRCYRVFSDDWRAEGDARGGELRFFVPESKSRVRQLVYPLLPAARESDDEFSFDLALDPLAVTDASRTYLRFTEDPGLSASGAFTVGGRPVGLRPLLGQGPCPAGFHLARRPRTSADSPHGPPGQPFVYLAPTGRYALDLPPEERPADGGRLMCGTSGLEYLRVRDGDMLEFVPGRPAYAPGFPEGDGGVGLDPSYTTSWVRLRPGPSPGPRGYYAQPAASVHYGHGVVPPQQAGTMDLPAAVSCLVRTLDRAAGAAFPMAFYGGALTSADDDLREAETLSRFEQQVLTGLRGACLRQDEAGEDPEPATREDGATADPVPIAPPVFTDADGEPLPGGRTTTPGGLVVELNDGSRPSAAKGTWKRVLLAAKGNQTLALNADGRTGTVDARLAGALVHDQVFLVLNDWNRFKDISAELLLAGFNFELAPSDGDPDTLLVVKRATDRSLTDLADSPADWAEPAYFIGGPPAVSRARGTLRAALRTAEDAEGETDDPFGYFRDVIATSPGWTGIVAFNSPINGNGMPESFQMLFAGIDGRLTAHHFGVEANRIQRDRDGLPEIAESSLFGVVHYAPPASEVVPPDPKPFDFRVRELNVAVRNSAVTRFHAEVAMTINELFGRRVHRATADAQDNSVAVTGRYLERDGIGTVAFEAADKVPFSFADGDAVRVLEAFTVTGAAITPTSSAAAGDGTTVKSRFALDGELHFRPHPFPEGDGGSGSGGTRYADLDLFSYGTGSDRGGAGLRMNGLALDLTCVLGKDGKRVGDTEIAPDLGGVQVTHSPAALRDEGLAARLPVTTTGFLHNERGLTAAALRGQGVNLVQLAGERGHTTSSPRYALRMDLPLGTLGNLAEAAAGLDASLVLGWGPNTYSPDDDAVGLFIQLPSVTAGTLGFELQGLLKTTFGDANLLQVRVTPKGGREPEPCFVLLFNNVALSVLGLRLPPKVITDFVLFAGEDPATGRRAIAWNLAATQLTASREGS
ncbi:hypothetical protein [Glycomyces xiaoerkulensis]|uniref:hypothetical protein n=1 Tax=Glycomyces xiaoerkulensis TaxID=2038139 RepID=UPI000C26B412|nr:hypothetical protein [Glycomyces xiaoerkulensis]